MAHPTTALLADCAALGASDVAPIVNSLPRLILDFLLPPTIETPAAIGPVLALAHAHIAARGGGTRVPSLSFPSVYHDAAAASAFSKAHSTAAGFATVPAMASVAVTASPPGPSAAPALPAARAPLVLGDLLRFLNAQHVVLSSDARSDFWRLLQHIAAPAAPAGNTHHRLSLSPPVAEAVAYALFVVAAGPAGGAGTPEAALKLLHTLHHRCLATLNCNPLLVATLIRVAERRGAGRELVWPAMTSPLSTTHDPRFAIAVAADVVGVATDAATTHAVVHSDAVDPTRQDNVTAESKQVAQSNVVVAVVPVWPASAAIVADAPAADDAALTRSPHAGNSDRALSFVSGRSGDPGQWEYVGDSSSNRTLSVISDITLDLSEV